MHSCPCCKTRIPVNICFKSFWRNNYDNITYSGMIHLHIVTIIFPIEINIKINYNFINLFPPELLPRIVA